MPRNVTIKNLAEVTAARLARPPQMRPQKVNGNWNMPKMSARVIAAHRRKAMRETGHWPYEVPHKIVEKRVPFKGHLRHLRWEQKQAEIARCMARMPQLVEEYRRNKRKKPSRDGFLELLRTPRERPME